MRGIIIIFNHCGCSSKRSERSVIRWMLDSLTRFHVLVDQTSKRDFKWNLWRFLIASVKMNPIRHSFIFIKIHRWIPFREGSTTLVKLKTCCRTQRKLNFGLPHGKFFPIEPVSWRKQSGNRHTSSRRCVYTHPNTRGPIDFTGVLAK